METVRATDEICAMVATAAQVLLVDPETGLDDDCNDCTQDCAGK